MSFFKKKDNHKFRDKYSYPIAYAVYLISQGENSRGSLPVEIIMAKSPAEAWDKAKKRFKSTGRLLKEECTLYDLFGPPKKVDIPHKICSECGDDLGIKC